MDKGILLVNLGTPSSANPKAVRAYLKQFLSDKYVVDLPRLIWLPILYFIILLIRPKRSAKAYQKIWLEEGSPLLVYTQRLANKLHPCVKIAMRYGQPSIDQALLQFKELSIKELTIIPLYPQYSRATTQSTIDYIDNCLKRLKWSPALNMVMHYYQHPSYINALCHSIETYWQQHGKPQKLLFSFHGIPVRYIKQYKDPYQHHCQQTVKLITEKLQLTKEHYALVYQSRFGKEPWLSPYCDQTLEQLPKQGVENVQVICPGFAVDCLETLEEINMQNKNKFIAAGGKQFSYIPALNDSDDHVNLLNNLAEQFNGE